MNHLLTYKKTIIAGLLAFAIPLAIYAAPMDNHEGRPMCGHDTMSAKPPMIDGIPPFLIDLDLSSEQKGQLKSLWESQKPEMEAEHQARHALMSEMQSLADAPELDENKAAVIADKLGTLEKESWLKRAKIGAKLFSVLTPEQRKQALENMRRHMSEIERMGKARIKPSKLSAKTSQVSHLIKA